MKKLLPGLNGLRALSVLIVILGHARLRSFDGFAVSFPLNMLFDGGFGVNVFFVISGFLITRLLLEEEKLNSKIDLKAFYIRRTLRIFPAYYFLLLVYFVLQLFSVLHFTSSSWLSSIFYYKYITGGDWESGHFWSLSVEEHFYLIWPGVFMLWKNGRKAIAFAVVAFVMVLRFNSYAHYFNAGIMDSDLSLFKRADALMVGCLFAMYEERLSAFVARFSRWLIAPAVVLIVAIAFINSDLLTRWNLTYKLHLGFFLVPLGIGSSHGLLTNILTAFLMLYSIQSTGVWAAFLNLPVMDFIGKLSYSLYLWQQLFFSERMGVLSSFPVNLLCIIAAALGSFYLIEKPFVKIKNKFSVHKRNDPTDKPNPDPAYVVA